MSPSIGYFNYIVFRFSLQIKKGLKLFEFKKREMVKTEIEKKYSEYLFDLYQRSNLL